MTTSDQSRNGDTSTYLQHAHSDLGGRFAVTERQTITGVVSPAPPPLQANSPWHGRDPVPTARLSHRRNARTRIPDWCPPSISTGRN